VNISEDYLYHLAAHDSIACKSSAEREVGRTPPKYEKFCANM
jgi:hypothetical protein